jgi:hypothetical protein
MRDVNLYQAIGYCICLAADILILTLKGHHPLNSIKPVSAFNSPKG